MTRRPDRRPGEPTREPGGGGRPFRPKPRFAKARIDAEAAAPRQRRDGSRPAERIPVILECPPSDTYRLIDSGDGAKLEQYGAMRLVRPEAQALWGRALQASEWERADAVFTGDTDEEGAGRWRYSRPSTGETWPLDHDGIAFLGRFTAYRHVGVFPEQAVHWRAMAAAIADAKRPVRMLNLFGYTGLASLVAARAGAEVTHVDASKKAVGWARENQAEAGMEALPVRWIVDDAMKFVQREERRGSRYDIILLDPPAYGRGPNGEVWQLFEHLGPMLDGCRAILSAKPLMVVLTAYAIRASFFVLHEMMRETMTGLGGMVESGELILRDRSAGRALSTSMFARWTPA